MKSITIHLSDLTDRAKTYLFLFCVQENITPHQAIVSVLNELAKKYLEQKNEN